VILGFRHNANEIFALCEQSHFSPHSLLI